MATFIREEYEAFKSRKNKTYTGTLRTYWAYDGDFVGRVAAYRGVPQGLGRLRLLNTKLPHPNRGLDAVWWLHTEIAWDYNTDQAPYSLRARITFQASEARESKLPDAEEIWARIGFRLGYDAKAEITKMLDAEEAGKAMANLTTVIQRRADACLGAVLDEAHTQARADCNYGERMALLNAEYGVHFAKRREGIVAEMACEEDDAEDALVIKVIEAMHHKFSRPAGQISSSSRLITEGAVSEWLGERRAHLIVDKLLADHGGRRDDDDD